MKNESAPKIQESAEIFINASPEQIWNILTDFTHWPDWNTDVTSMNFAGPLAPGTSFVWKAGGITIHSTLHDVVPHSKITWLGKAPGIQAQHSYILTPQNGGTLVQTTESFDGWLPSLLPRYMKRKLRSALESGLAMLEKAVEKRMTIL